MAEMGNNIYADSVDIYIHAYYARFCREEGAIDQYIITSPQNTWHGCMKYIYDHYIRGMDLLDKDGRYNIDMLEGVLSLYMDLCGMYDKVITVTGYGRLLGLYENDIDYILNNSGMPYRRYIYKSSAVHDHTITYNGSTPLEEGSSIGSLHSGGSYSRELSTRYIGILNTIRQGREGSTAAKLTASKGNMLGLLAVANHYHSWNAPGISYDDTRRAALDASQLPQLGGGPATTAPPLPGDHGTVPGIPAGDDDGTGAGAVSDDWTGSNG